MPRVLRLLLATSVLSVALAVPAATGAWENTGCTPGYWKNHTSAWNGYSPTQAIGSVFSSAPAPYASMTLLQGLSLKGGSGTAGATQILLRAAIAAVLNEYPDFAYSKINRVNAAIASGDRERILRLATRLDVQNNGDCAIDWEAGAAAVRWERR